MEITCNYANKPITINDITYGMHDVPIDVWATLNIHEELETLYIHIEEAIKEDRRLEKLAELERMIAFAFEMKELLAKQKERDDNDYPSSSSSKTN